MTVHQALLFDMDGVVVDTAASIAEFWRDLAGAEGVALSDSELDSDVHGRSAEHTLATLFPHLARGRYPEVYERMRANQEALTYAEVPGVSSLLRELTAARVPVALVTGAEKFKVVAVLEQLGLTDTFDAVIGAEDVEAGKPDPASYLAAARLLDADVRRCVVFEDAVNGVTAAVAAGARCVGVAAAHQAERLRSAGAHPVVPDFRGVTFSAADRTVSLDSSTSLPFLPAGRTVASSD
ncbi:MAG TPA: HAD family phosphatase [Mycobacteriales bacterium]